MSAVFPLQRGQRTRTSLYSDRFIPSPWNDAAKPCAGEGVLWTGYLFRGSVFVLAVPRPKAPAGARPSEGLPRQRRKTVARSGNNPTDWVVVVLSVG